MDVEMHSDDDFEKTLELLDDDVSSQPASNPHKVYHHISVSTNVCAYKQK